MIIKNDDDLKMAVKYNLITIVVNFGGTNEKLVVINPSVRFSETYFWELLGRAKIVEPQ